MIKILSGWSNAGGSTEAFINLTNALNKAGYETVFYGPHTFHLDKCKAEQTHNKFTMTKDDILIVHFLNKFQVRPPIKKMIFSSHEQNIFPLRNINYKVFDKIHYVSEHQKAYHNIDHPSFVISNLITDIKPNNLNEKVVGIIGSIDRNKRVDLSIRRALKDGYKKILIYGNITDPMYWEQSVRPLVDGSVVVYKGFEANKQVMYDSISDIYFSSEMECLPYVLAEAKIANKTVHGIEGKNYLNAKYEFNNQKILETWIKELELDSNTFVPFFRKPKINAYFLAWNEEKILPHLIRYYSKFCNKITIMDNGSTDRTVEIAKSFPNVEVISYDSNNTFNDMCNAQMKNNVWKKDRNDCDLVLVADTDEFIYHPNLLEFLDRKLKEGYTIFRPHGYHMIGDVDLDLKDDDDIFQKIDKGIRVNSLDKYIMFDPKKITEINLSVGSHACNPIGVKNICYDPEFKMKHFKFLGLENYLNKCRRCRTRMSDFNKQHNLGLYYLEDDNYHRRDYMDFLSRRNVV